MVVTNIRLNQTNVNGEKEQSGFAEVMFGSAYRIRTGGLLLEREVS
jgi:hypothetical protein